MKSLVQLLLLLLLVNSCTSSQHNEVMLHPIVQQAKETSLYSDQLNWSAIDVEFKALVEGKTTVAELKDGLQFLINSLGDKHAAFRSVKDNSIIVSYTGEVKEGAFRDPDFVNEVINDITSRFSYQLLDNGVGYLKIVGIAPGKIKENADFIRTGLTDLKEQGADKWILDLRYNGGGDMNPMLAGLAPLIGDGFIGGSVDNKDSLTHRYEIKNGQFSDTGNLVCEMDSLPVFNSTEKVAVLLSRYTISSGELVAISFKGRENTSFIGEPTAGYTTGNGWDQVTDELIMNISQGVFVDRNGIKYSKNVGVDEEIEFKPIDSLNKDAQVKAAVNWLQQ